MSSLGSSVRSKTRFTRLSSGESPKGRKRLKLTSLAPLEIVPLGDVVSAQSAQTGKRL